MNVRLRRTETIVIVMQGTCKARGASEYTFAMTHSLIFRFSRLTCQHNRRTIRAFPDWLETAATRNTKHNLKVSTVNILNAANRSMTQTRLPQPISGYGKRVFVCVHVAVAARG